MPNTTTPTSERSSSAHDSARIGLLYGLAAYLSWGVVPLYFKLVTAMPALEVLAHRIVWSVLFLAILITLQRKWRLVIGALRSGRVMIILLATTALIGFNWFLFIWAVMNDLVLQASLGYFINPLVTVLLGVVFLRERLRAWQIGALALAAVGVVNLAVASGAVPWVSLALAVSFAFYGLLRKIVNVGPLVGLFIETTLLLPFGAYLVAMGMMRDLFGPGAGGDGDMARLYVILLFAGVVTSLPLIWFNNAARRLRLSTMGFLQYLSPTCQFLLAVFIFKEAFTTAHAITFALIWVAVAVYSFDSIRAYREARRTAVQEPMTFVQE